MKTIAWAAITAMVPVTLSAALEELPRLSTSHTQAIGSRGSRFFITVCRMKTPDKTPRKRLISMKICLSHLRTQSRLKSFTRARSVARFVAVESSDRSQMMKKWYGTIDCIFARPIDCIPMPVMIC